VLVDEDAWGPARLSRWRAPFFRSPAYESEEFWPWLADLHERLGLDGWTLIPTHDEQVRQLALHFDDARSRFRFAGLRWDQYRLIYDKRESHAWCERHGIPAPLSHAPRDRDDLPPPDWKYPLIVKPAVKTVFKRYSAAKAIQVSDAEGLKRLLKGPLARVPIDQLLYQEIIPGGGDHQFSYAGYFDDGQPIAAFTACRLRQHPPDFGRASTYVRAVPDPEVEQQSLRVLSLLRYTGLAEVEWKRDLRDGALKFLEVNARSWGWHSLSSGVVGELVPILLHHLAGGKMSPAVPQYGASWVKHVTDIPVAFDMIRSGDLTLSSYLRSLRGEVIGCEWHWRDPFPFFAQFALVPYLALKRGY
jgi:predicted ATP-grasp superfamily ATP-dependent carboligase